MAEEDAQKAPPPPWTDGRLPAPRSSPAKDGVRWCFRHQLLSESRQPEAPRRRELLFFDKPLGILMAAGVALAAGLHLPRRVGWRELIVLGFTAAIGFSVALFFCAALLPPGQLRAEMRMGVLLSLAGAPLALVSARLLRVGRFAPQ